MKFKKLFSAIAAAAVAASMTMTASADVIWEPIPDEFYEQHLDSAVTFVYDRRFVSDVDVDVYDQPYQNIVGVIEAGKPKKISIVVTDDDGKKWGSITYDGFDSWICIDGMSLIYDSTEFIKDHMGEFTEYNGELTEDSFDGNPVCYWNYPGSSEYYTDSYYPGDFGSYVSYVYKDDNGSWGYIGYIAGHRDVWLYMDAPTDPAPEKLADELAQTEFVTVPYEPESVTVPSDTPAPESEEVISQIESEEVVTGTNSENPPTEDRASAYLPAVIMAVSAAAIAVVCLAVLGKKKDKAE